jgi:sigma-B regulation protein RsbU (phosphoserine phosphatase)
VIRAAGEVERLGIGGPVLGVFPDGRYEQGHLVLKSGDRIIFYTDGITDVCNAADEEFGDARLVELAVANRGCSAPALHARLAGAVQQFSDGRFVDDATLIVMAAE